MSLDRRSFLIASAAGAVLSVRRGPAAAATVAADGASPAPATPRASRTTAPSSGYDPWLEIYPDVLVSNATAMARLAGGRPVVAVVKNNAYGLGLERVGPTLDAAPEIEALAVVTPAAAHALRDAGVAKPILHMGLATSAESVDLARRGVRLAPFTDGAPTLLRDVARALGRPVPVHLYLDTGMGRLGMPVHRALPWLERVTADGHAEVEGSFTALVEDDDFDREQLARFDAFAAAAADRRLPLGRRHAASTHALFFRDDHALLDAVRPGLALYGALPAPAAEAAKRLGAAAPAELAQAGESAGSALRPAFSLKARVVRVERLRPGDGVSYGRNWVAERPTWVAALPVGHADGYPRSAVDGAEVLIGGRTWPVIGAVSASHAIVELGEAVGEAEPEVAIGDVATLVGPDHPAVHPNTVAARADRSVYDILMHLGARLPGVVIDD